LKDIEIVGLDEVFESLHTLKSKTENLEPLLRQVGQFIQNATEDSFEEQKSPFGHAWKPNKKKPKNNSSKKILIDSGILRGSFTVDADDNEVSVGTNVVYAAIHHFGGKAGRNRGVKIPARPFMPIDSGGNMPSDLVSEIMEYLADELMEE